MTPAPPSHPALVPQSVPVSAIVPPHPFPFSSQQPILLLSFFLGVVQVLVVAIEPVQQVGCLIRRELDDPFVVERLECHGGHPLLGVDR